MDFPPLLHGVRTPPNWTLVATGGMIRAPVWPRNFWCLCDDGVCRSEFYWVFDDLRGWRARIPRPPSPLLRQPAPA